MILVLVYGVNVCGFKTGTFKLKQLFPGVMSGIAAASGAAADLQFNHGTHMYMHVKEHV